MFDEFSFPGSEKIVTENPVKEPTIPEIKKVESVQDGASAELVFGKFMRALRKRGASGVLFTMCSDLEFFFEGETLVLTTTSDTIFRALKREDHEKVMKELFGSLGVSFEVRKKAAKTELKHGISELEQNFSDYPVQVKEK